MGIIIKKASKKTIVSILSLIGLILALATKIFAGESGADLSKLGSSKAEHSHGGFLIDVANADYPQSTNVTTTTDVTVTVTSTSDGGGAGSCGGSASGSGGDSSDW